MPIEPRPVGASRPSIVDESNKAPQALKPAFLPTADKRREARYPCQDPAKVRILNDSGGIYFATLVDISRSGLCIEIEANLGTGAKVEITLPREAIIFGEVRYCRRTAPGYQAGIFIEDVFYAHRADTGEHIHDDTLSHYLESKGLGAREILSVRDHLLHCNLCSARYDVVAKLQDRHGAAATDL